MDLTLTIGTFVLFTGLVALLTWIMSRGSDNESSSGYFLAGRQLTGPLIAGSLLLTNLSTEQMVGLNGDAFSGGLHVMVWEVVAVIALVLMAMFFLPKFLRSGVATVPEFLELRFDKTTRVITTLVFLSAYAFILLPIVLYTGARGLNGMLDMEELTGFSEFYVVALTVAVVGVIGAIYALFGGLKAVAISDTLNGAGLLIGGMMIVYFGLSMVGGDAGAIGGWQTLRDTQSDRFNSIGGNEDSVPFFTIFTGVFLLNVFYWCTNQQIIQRTFGASDLKEGQKGVLLCGALKLLGPLYLVIPGMIAFQLYQGDDTVSNSTAYGRLVGDVLPPYWTGFFMAVMAGAILSSFNSALNSACTLFSLDVYKGMIAPNASESQVVASGKWFGWIVASAAILGAPYLIGQESIFGYLQKMNGLYFIPILSVVFVGMVSRNVPGFAANVGLVLGLIVIAIGYFVPLGAGGEYVAGDMVNDYHFLGIVFWSLVVLMLLLGAIAPRSQPWYQEHSGDVEMNPWPLAWPMAMALCFLVFAIYWYFADFSVVEWPWTGEPQALLGGK